MRYLLRQLWPAVLLLVAWQFWADRAGFNRIVLVTPVAVLRDLIHAPGAYITPSLHTFAYALGGLCIGLMAGVAMAVLAELSEILAGMTLPIALVLSSTPVVCLIPIVARIFGYGGHSEMATVALMTFFPSFLYACRGLRELPQLSAEMFQSLAASRLTRLWLLALPSAMPAIATALRLGASVSVLVALVAEYLMQTGGLGTLFAVTMQRFDMARALGASLIAMALSVMLYEAGRALELRVHHRYRG